MTSPANAGGRARAGTKASAVLPGVLLALRVPLALLLEVLQVQVPIACQLAHLVLLLDVCEQIDGLPNDASTRLRNRAKRGYHVMFVVVLSGCVGVMCVDEVCVGVILFCFYFGLL